MILLPDRRTVFPEKAELLRQEPIAQFSVIALPLLLGLIVGSVLGMFSVFPAEISSFSGPVSADAQYTDLALGFWRAFRFVIAALILSSTFLGVMLIPALSAVRGFLLGCTVAAAFHSDSFRGLLLASFTVGIPALLGFPAFLIAASDARRLSASLLAFLLRGERTPPFQRVSLTGHTVAVLLLSVSEALYSCFLLPKLISAAL